MPEDILNKQSGGHLAVEPEEIMRKNIQRLKDASVRDIMTPRAQIHALSEETVEYALIDAVSEASHDCLPVYRDDLDQIIGSVSIHNLIKKTGLNAREEWHSLIRPVSFVAPSMRAWDLFIDLRSARKSTAIVVDEYGGTDGLVMMSDLMEAIVSGMAGEDEMSHSDISKSRSDGSLIADACLPLKAVEQHFGVSLNGNEGSDVDTLGGLATTLAGRVPRRGETTRHASGIEIEVVDADPRRVNKVRVHFSPPKTGEINASSGS